MKKTRMVSRFLSFLIVTPSLILIPSLIFPQVQRRSEVVQVVEKAGLAVVNISTEQKQENIFSKSILEEIFSEKNPEGRGNEYALGSGVIIDSRGYILTNEHVILAAQRIRVSLSDKREYFAEVVGADSTSDLAVLKIDPKEPLPAVKLGRSSGILIGETVIAIGNPFGFSSTVTTGVVSALRRKLRGRDNERTYSDFIQIDAAINPGNSGGALLNINGELIGINTAIISQAEGIGFAIPIDRAKKVFDEIVNYREVRPLWTGMDVATIDQEMKRYLKTREERGVVVVDLYPESPAQTAGINAGDIIVSLGNEKIESQEDFNTALSKYNIGDRLSLSMRGKSGARTAYLRIASFPYNRISYERLGMEVENGSSSIFSFITGSQSKGIVISRIKPQGAAHRRGLKSGDMILQIDNSMIKNVDDYNKLLPRIASRGSVYLVVVRGRYSYRLTMELD